MTGSESKRKNSGKNETRLPLWPIVFFFWVFLAKLHFLLTSAVLREVSGHLYGRLVASVVTEDAGILMILVLLSLVRGTPWRKAAGFLVVLLCLFYFVDMAAMRCLNARFTWPTVYRYYKDWSIILTFVNVKGILYGAALVGILWLSGRKRVRLPLGRLPLAGVALVLGSIPWLAAMNRPVNPFLDMVSANVVRINQKVVINREFDPGKISEIRSRFSETARGFDRMAAGEDLFQESTARRPNMVLLVSESLSQIDSRRSGGLFDRLPGIDRIQREGLTLTQVVSDGNDTGDAIASLLLGVNPLPTPMMTRDMPRRFPAEALAARSLVKHAERLGYRTAAMSSAVLHFQRCGPWLEKLGFDLVQGGDSKVFSEEPRFTFNSPCDEALYDRALAFVDRQERPYFLFLLTVSLHKPYILPSGDDLEEADPLLRQLRYVDRTTYAFYEGLYKRGFFENGVLVIVGDHRRMDIPGPQEMEKRGTDAYGRVVCTIAGSGVERGEFVHAPMAQTDINTVLHRTMQGGRLDRHRVGNCNKSAILGIPESFTTHIMNDELGLILVRTGNADPRPLTFHGGLDPAGAAGGRPYPEITAYLAMSANWLDRKQSGLNRARAPSAGSNR